MVSRETPLGRRVGVAQRASAALRANLERRVGDHRFDDDGKLFDWTDSLIGSVDKASILADPTLTSDRGKYLTADSSAGLALNLFGPWRKNPGRLDIAGVRGFEALRFNARCPTGVRGTPPILDLLLAGRGGVVAVAARCVEFISRRRSKVAKGYEAVAPIDGLDAWIDALDRLAAGDLAFRHVDPTALSKYALGLARTFPKRSVTLLYLFWEPPNHAQFPQFADHRREIDELASLVETSAVRLRPCAMFGLLDDWSARAEPPWLRNHVAELKGRYQVTIPA